MPTSSERSPDAGREKVAAARDGHDRVLIFEAPIASEEPLLGALSMAGLDEVEIVSSEANVQIRVYWAHEAGPPPDVDLSRVSGAHRRPDEVRSRHDWAEGWPDHRIGPFLLSTRDGARIAPDGRQRIVLSKGLGFGFGDHPSTRAALLALADLP
ncbi:MAG: hypothetical protein AAFN74_21995, partial [Myxococcota bacterium]